MDVSNMEESKITKISGSFGTVGFLHEVECKENDSVLIFQLPRATQWINDDLTEKAKKQLIKFLPEGRSCLVIGADINVYELGGADAIILKLKGLI
jgi:hypothetical protein